MGPQKQQIKRLAEEHNTVTPGAMSLKRAIFDHQSNALPTEPKRSTYEAI